MVGDLTSMGVPVFSIPIYPDHKSLWNMASSFVRIARIVVTQQVDVIHSHHRWAEFIAWLVSKLLRVPTLSTCHSLVTGYRMISYRSDRVVAVSCAVKKVLVNDFYIPESKISVIRNRARLLPVPSLSDIEKFRRTVGPKASVIIAAIGRLHQEKGFDILLTACADTSMKDLPIKLVIAGDGPERDHLTSLSEQYALPAAFVGELAQIEHLLASCDIVVVPSRRESAGLVVLEAAQFQKPVIVTAVGGLLETITHMKNGIVIPPNDVHSLRDAIVGLAKNTALRQQLGKALFEEVIEEQASDAAIVQVYSSLFAHGKHKTD